MDIYTKRRIHQLRGNRPHDQAEDGITQYTQRRIRELAETGAMEADLDKSLLGCYTMKTMGDRND